MYQFILIVHIFAAICLVALVLVQQGKGATMGAAFGSGASQTVFGSKGSGSFLLRITIGFVIVFFSTSIALNYMASRAVRLERQMALPVPVTHEAGAPPAITPGSIPTTSGDQAATMQQSVKQSDKGKK